MKYDIKNKDVISSEGNTDICLTEISWNNREYKKDLRKWMKKDDSYVPMKGLTLTDSDLNKLAELLIEKGYGNKDKLQSLLENRPNEKHTLFTIVEQKNLITTDDILKSIRKD